MKASHSATVSATPEQVWALLADHEGMSEWGPMLKVSIDKPNDTVPGGVGTVRRITASGPAPDIVEEITVFEPGQRLGYKGLAGVPFRNYRGLVELSPAAQGTEITWTLEADNKLPSAVLKPVAMGLLSALVRQVRKVG